MNVEKLSYNKKLVNVINKLHSEAWSVFLNEDPFVKKYWRQIYKVYPEYQLLFKIDSEYVGVGNSAPIYWNGNIDDLPSGFDEAIKTIIEGNEKPIRPTLKSQYPTIPMSNYINWEKNNLPFDPWIRVHIKMGGEILKVANPSMIVRGTVSDWQKWTGMYFGESNKYIVQGALNPINIDLENNLGEYIEPNI